MKAIDAVAEAWASIDGKLKSYEADRDQLGGAFDEYGRPTGYFDGYQCDAGELLRRVEQRGFVLVPVGTFTLELEDEGCSN